MSNTIKRIDIQEFQQFGFLQEANRQFFHPLGLALEIIVEEDKPIMLGGIWDYREDPEGIIFADLSDEESRAKAERVEALFEEKKKGRQEKLGYIIQPIGDVE